MPITVAVLKGLKRGSLFVETGCEIGEGIAAALEAGFEKVISIELDEFNALHAQLRFGRQPVTVIRGDTVDMLPKVLAELKEPATFWLDAHGTFSPVLEELQHIAASGIKEHTILIDDRRLMAHPWPTEEKVREALLQVNPLYAISYANGFVPDDIIVAQAL